MLLKCMKQLTSAMNFFKYVPFKFYSVRNKFGIISRNQLYEEETFGYNITNHIILYFQLSIFSNDC